MTASARSSSTTQLLTLLHQYSTLHTLASTSLKSTIWQITKARHGRGHPASSSGLSSLAEYSVGGVREELVPLAHLIVADRGGHDEPALVVSDEFGESSNDDKELRNGNTKNFDSSDSSCLMVLHFAGMEGTKLAASSSAAAAHDADSSEDASAKVDTSNDHCNNFIGEEKNSGLRRRRRGGVNRGNSSNNNNDGRYGNYNLGSSNDNSSDMLKSKWIEEELVGEDDELQQPSTIANVDKNNHKTSNFNCDNNNYFTHYSDPLQLFGIPPPSLRVAQSHSRDALAYYVEVANLARQIMNIVVRE